MIFQPRLKNGLKQLADPVIKKPALLRRGAYPKNPYSYSLVTFLIMLPVDVVNAMM